MENEIMRQTDYTFEVATERIRHHNGNKEAIVREYLGLGRGEEEKRSTNQEIFRQIRNQLNKK